MCIRVSHFRGFKFFIIRQLSNKKFCWLSENCVLTCWNICKKCQCWQHLILWNNFLCRCDNFLKIICNTRFHVWSFFIFAMSFGIFDTFSTKKKGLWRCNSSKTFRFLRGTATAKFCFAELGHNLTAKK